MLQEKKSMMLSDEEIVGVLAFLLRSMNLLIIKREGLREYLDPEELILVESAERVRILNVGEHSYMVTLLVDKLVFCYDAIDGYRAVRMAMHHDLPEAIAGDTSPYAGLPLACKDTWPPPLDAGQSQRRLLEQQSREREGLQRVVSPFVSLLPHMGADIVDLWSDYHQRKSRESELVEKADRFLALLEAFWCYAGKTKKMKAWWERARSPGRFEDSLFQRFVDQLERVEAAYATGTFPEGNLLLRCGESLPARVPA
jgi:5'-deoxynucleotidase YfbR-like HD superfamily hydrolase